MSCKDCLFNYKCDTAGKRCEHYINNYGLLDLIQQHCFLFGYPYNDEAQKETVSKIQEYLDNMWRRKIQGISIRSTVDWNNEGGLLVMKNPIIEKLKELGQEIDNVEITVYGSDGE